jgi:dephospho-CoA kinase
VDRKKLSKIVFNDPARLKSLNGIVHPALKAHVKKTIERSRENVLLDIALLSELNLDDIVEHIILVEADVTKVYRRLRDRFSKREIINIMNNQHIVKKPDFIIENNGTIDELEKKTLSVISRLLPQTS